MNDDYLWDKSGEPDPEIKELEEILAPLRYQPKPLIIPETPKRNYVPLLAIAATVLIALLAAGVWLRLRTEKAEPQQQAKSVPSVPTVPSEDKEPPTPEVAENTAPPKKVIRKRIRKPENKEALAAKEQVMLALRVASEKLKFAQKQIKNPHKVG